MSGGPRRGVIPLGAGGAVRTVRRDGKVVTMFQCPGCDQWGDVDDDQWNGRVSIQHDACGYHETRDLQGELNARVVGLHESEKGSRTHG